MGLPDLILIKHAQPLVDSARAPKDWTLAPSAEAQCERVTRRLRPYGVSRIFGSDEPKAAQTAQRLGSSLEVPVEVRRDLHENDRSGVPFYGDPRQLDRQIYGFFSSPSERVMGRETADEAHARFTAALRGCVADDDETVAVVSHGVVISLLIARSNDLDPYGIWKQLSFGSFAVLSRPSLALREIVHDAAD